MTLSPYQLINLNLSFSKASDSIQKNPNQKLRQNAKNQSAHTASNMSILKPIKRILRTALDKFQQVVHEHDEKISTISLH